MAFIDQITNRLTDKVGGDGIASKVVLFQQFPTPLNVTGLSEGSLNVKMIAPASKLDAVVAHLFHTWKKLCKWDISPLPSE